MDSLFLHVINMSITAGYVIIFVAAIRLLLKKLPKIYSYMLWLAVLFRLVCPFSFESMLSLIPKNINILQNINIPQDIAYSAKPEISSGIAAVDNIINNVLPAPLNEAASINPMQVWLAVGEAIWIAGIAMLLIYSVFTAVKLKRNLKYAKHIENNIFITDSFKTPFVFGIINPGIYLPSNLSESERSYVLLHEQTHIKRADHIVKPVFFLITCIHWFNPLVWLAFYLMSEDMELSCDEKVVKQMGSNIKKEYSASLLSMSTGRKIVGGCPLAFGENNTKGRIKNILNYKRPAFWVLAVVVIVIVVIIAGLIANPKTEDNITEDNISDLRPMIMVNGDLYLDTGREVPVEMDESAILGEIKSSVAQYEKPTEEGQTNFGFIGAEYAYFEGHENYIVLLINNEWVLFEKEMTPAARKRFYIMTADDGAPFGCEYGTTYETGQIDTLEMLSMLEELNGFEFDEDYVSHQYIKFDFLDEKPSEIYLRYITDGEWQTEYPIDSATYRIKVPAKAGTYSFFADITWDNQEKETVFFDIIIRNKKPANQDKISAYLKEESIAVFSPYYELLDFKISNYEEKIADGKVEAIFNYTIVSKNYDRDPDTVEYIKEAKESGNMDYYQTLYDEYLQPKDGNFYFKAVIDENDNITLYYNANPKGIDWQEVEMSDYIIK